MLTFGDVLAMVAGLIGICLSAWTTLVVFSLFFPSRAAQAADSIRKSAPGMGFRGLGIAAVLLFATVILFGMHRPLPVLIAWLLLLTLFSLGALGCSGLTMVVADRVLEHEPQLSPYAALMRGAALVVVPGLLPVFGWFLVGPAMLFVGIGAGTKALRLVAVTAQP